MPDFRLKITPTGNGADIDLQLLDQHGSQLAYHQADLGKFSFTERSALFDLQGYLKEQGEGAALDGLMAELGVRIAEDILGEEIFLKLWTPQARRTLTIALPGANAQDRSFAAALARIPYEIARPARGKESLAEKALLVRIVHDFETSPNEPLTLEKDEPLRVLFVFAEAKGSRPLALRQERRRLQQLFKQEIYPKRRIVAHFLTHGVTRERLQEQIDANGGYHIVHWSGHGSIDSLELAKAEGGRDHITGQDLLDLFEDAGGFFPRLIFLSACHSGNTLTVRDWKGFLNLAEGKEPTPKKPGEKETPATGGTREIPVPEESSFTGTAHSLLQAGVPSLVAMRFAVGDLYAADLAVEFYRSLLADVSPKSPAAALTQARQALRNAAIYPKDRYFAADPATPVLFGVEDPRLPLPNGRSPESGVRIVRLPAIAELSIAAHSGFVGRTWELADLGARFIGTSRGLEVKPVACLVGLGGMGKTALVAEALDLWETRFNWLLLFQAKPSELRFDTAMQEIHRGLMGELGQYHRHVEKAPADAVWREPSGGFTGEAHQDRLITNLIRALQDEPILLVLDNFETCLKPAPKPGSDGTLYECRDDAWERCLTRLSAELVGSSSRVLLTCRRRLSALSGEGALTLPLGPLPTSEAALYLRENPALHRMVVGGDKSEAALAMRLLAASRFHPLLMDRLTRLATGGETFRDSLLEALAVLEKRKSLEELPDLFAARDGAASIQEREYLEDALSASNDQLIGDASLDARQVLYILSLANDPVALGLLQNVWSGERANASQLRQIKSMLQAIDSLPAELQEKLRGIPPEFRARVEAVPDAPPTPLLEPLVASLVALGLVTAEKGSPEDENPDLTCHEVVRERVRAWMESRPGERGEWSEAAVKEAYGEHLQTAFEGLRERNLALALEAGKRAIVYFVEAGVYERLGAFASRVVTSASDPRLLRELVGYLESAATLAPEGEARWSCLTILADALSSSGRPDLALPHFESAASMARAVAESGVGGVEEHHAWGELGWILGNWAGALLTVGDYGGARQRQTESGEAERQAGNPEANILGSELEALRIDVIQGKIDEALPAILAALERVEGWWNRYQAGERVPEARDAEVLARAYIAALDIAREVHVARNDWSAALECMDKVLAVKEKLKRPVEDLAITRMNRAVLLQQLAMAAGREGDREKASALLLEAIRDLEACLEVFEGQNNWSGAAKTLSSLASVLDDLGDIKAATLKEQHALAYLNSLPEPGERAISHTNLAIYLKTRGGEGDALPASRHQLAGLVYTLVLGMQQQLQTLLHNYAVNYRRARQEGQEVFVPRLTALLADPAFDTLKRWLEGNGVPLDTLQAAIDQYLAQARQAAEQ